jgi:protein-S-isoprenylcysteine O-methyltransferase Ste14
LLLGAAIALGVILNFLWPAKILARALAVPLGILIVLGAVTIAFLAVREMSAARTPLNVRKAPTRIVSSGIFQRSRNPIYLGMVLLCAGIAFVVDSLWLLALTALLAAVLQKGMIEPEEAYLERNFGEDYLRYKTKVRRWI